MPTVSRCFAAVAVACWALVALGRPASAQRLLVQTSPPLFPVNPNPLIGPGIRLQQYAYNTVVLGQAYSQLPPYLFGYNPYPGAYYGSLYYPQLGGSAGYGGAFSPYYGGNAYTGNYGGGYSLGGVDPLTGLPIGGGNGSYGGGKGSNGGGYSNSSASDLQAYGQLGLAMEQARILREQAEQAKLDTRKKLIDTLAYVRAHEYTFTQQQADVAKRILERIQKMPTQQEVASGKSLNILSEELGRLSNLPVRGQTVNLEEELLKLLNVTGTQGDANLGLLRDNGRFAWPSVFDEKNIIGDKERKDIELHAQELFQQAVNAKIDKNTLKDLQSGLRGLRQALSKNANQVPTPSLLEGHRFLDDFDAAVLALERGDAALNLDFQQKFARGGKTVQELVEYMKARGLRFAPANPGDERAYQALQTALAAQSLAVSSQIAAGRKE